MHLYLPKSVSEIHSGRYGPFLKQKYCSLEPSIVYTQSFLQLGSAQPCPEYSERVYVYPSTIFFSQQGMFIEEAENASKVRPRQYIILFYKIIVKPKA